MCLMVVALSMTVAAGPAPTGCPQERCFQAVNECNEKYGACWDECSLPPMGAPTFTRPICSATSAVSGIIPTPSDNATMPMVAPSPTTTGTAAFCSPASICVDAMTMCGDQTILYGACYDICTSTTLTPPPCTRAPAITTSPQGTATSTSKKPKKTRGPCTVAKSWLCAPAGW
ncbi:hypothetical protein K505DRAFT_338111 [Melanomma pulvis-pyrius CBS 109.77]|uniref:Uncharacterized protein n=1 Tax=Melanomma pulvis-pyrius CBS 109.77 TaxID=1314802 RepID=A0A6A6XB13_9PLEO|nr:hypothetical protein K505DRAFT_338111 [Melanomma pulvis-pyrius CBS 109.77]